VREHRDVFDLLGVIVEERAGGYWLVKWTEGRARAFQLLHVLLHELGHHRDRMTTRSRQGAAPRGEAFAETYARQYESRIWDD
jgi:hypothetical protein